MDGVAQGTTHPAESRLPCPTFEETGPVGRRVRYLSKVGRNNPQPGAPLPSAFFNGGYGNLSISEGTMNSLCMLCAG